MGNQFSQAFPPKPAFTESSLPSLSGKVYIVTGANAGVGRELARILYSRSATVYLACRTASKAEDAMKWIKESHAESSGVLNFLPLDLNDLEGIKTSANEFLSKEKRLDVLWNNAGVMIPPKGSVTKQNYDMQLGVNCLAPFLFTKLLTPLLLETAKASDKGSVRVVWVSSSAADLKAPKGGVDMSNITYAKDKGLWDRYAISKAGNILHALEFSKRYEDQGVVSVSLNPGNLKSDLQRHLGGLQSFFVNMMCYPAVNGAYTELFAGLNPAVAGREKGTWVVPFGRLMKLRQDMAESASCGPFWEYSEKETAKYA